MKPRYNFRARTFWALLPIFALIAVGQPAPTTPQAVVESTFGSNLPFDLLPKDRQGNILSIERARAEVKTARNIAVRESLNQWFPPQSKQSNPEWWRQTTDSQGRVYTIPNETHPRFQDYTRTLNDRYDQIQQNYQTRYGDRYEAFSRAVFDNAPDGVRLIGRAQENLFSDIDATFRDPAQRQAMVDSLTQAGFTVEQSPGDHGLYVRVKELDWVQWSNDTVEDLQRQYDAAEHNPTQREEIGRRLQAAMRDAEVCATTVGSRYALNVPGGSEDPVGSTLDHLKKFAQSDDLETKSKVVCKIGPGDDSDTARIRRANQGLPEAQGLLRDYAGDKRALQMEHLPLALQEERRAEFRELLLDEAAASYRKSVLDSQVADRATAELRATMVRELDQHTQRNDVVKMTVMQNAIAALDAKERQKRLENDRTLREIARSDPELHRRMTQGVVELQQNVARLNPDDRQVRDRNATRSTVRDGWMNTETLQRWGAVATDVTTRLSNQTGAVFDKVGQIGGYAAVADEAFARAARGDGSAMTHIAEGVAKDAAIERISQRFPKFGSMMQVINVPSQMVAEMEAEMDRAEARGSGNYTGAKMRAVWNVMKQNTFIGTFEKALYEEGLAEVENELASGSYSYGAVAYRTAVTTVGEVTQMNAALRFGANTYYDVYNLEAKAEAEEQKLRNKLRAKSLGADASLDALSRQIIALQLDPNVDDEIVQRRIRELQAQFDAGVKGMRETGKRFRQKYGADDPQVNDLYRRSQIAIERQHSNLLEAKITRLAFGNDPLEPATWNKFKDLREEYRKVVEETKAKAKFLIAHQGVTDPLTQEALARARRMRDMSAKLEDVKFDMADVRQRENDAERKQRDNELDSYAEAMKKRLPEHLKGTSDDYFLAIELDDLVIKQGKGQIEQGADLVGMAIENMDRDFRYRELVKKQQAGEIDEDADLLELLDGESTDVSADEVALDEDGETIDAFGGATGDEEYRDTEIEDIEELDNEQFDAFADNPNNRPVFYGVDGQDLPFGEPAYVHQGTEGPAPVPSAERTVNGKPQGIHETKDSSGRVYSVTCYLNGMKHGYTRNYDRNTFQLGNEKFYHSDQAHGPERRFKNGVLVAERYYHGGKQHGPDRTFYDNGSPRGEAFYNSGAKQGPERAFYEDGTLKSEKWYADGHLHGWWRQWTENGKLYVERFGTRIENSDHYFITRSFDRDSGRLKSEIYLDLGKPMMVGSSLKFPKLERRYDDAEQVRLEVRTLADDRKFGVSIITDSNGRRTITTYRAPDQRAAVRIEDAKTGQLLETARYVQDEAGKDWPQGAFTVYQPADSPLAGKEQIVAHYNRGVLHGKYVQYDDEGEVELEGTFRDGSPDGAWQKYSHGHLTNDLNYHDGVLEGLQKTWAFTRGNSDPHPEMEAEIRGDRVPRFAALGTGRCRRVVGTSTLQLKAVEPTKLAPQTRPYVGFSPPWPFSVHDLRQAAVITGTLQEWFVTDGQDRMQLEETYRDGVLNGPRKAYYANGQLFVSENISNGVLDGTCQAWFYNGEKSATVSFVNGFRHGTVTFRERDDYPEVTFQAVNGVGLGWVTSYQYGGRLYATTYYAKPTSPRTNMQPAKPHLENPQKSIDQCPQWAPHAEAWGDKVGPQIYYSNNEPNQITYFGYADDGRIRSTKDVNEYLEWAAVDRRLPTDVPRLGPLKATRKLNVSARDRSEPKAVQVYESDVAAPPSGLSAEEAHGRMMELWREANALTQEHDYRAAQVAAMKAARLGRAYPATEGRSVVVSYIKAADAAKAAGETGVARSYLTTARQAAEEFRQDQLRETVTQRLEQLE